MKNLSECLNEAVRRGNERQAAFERTQSEPTPQAPTVSSFEYEHMQARIQSLKSALKAITDRIEAGSFICEKSANEFAEIDKIATNALRAN